ncbi:MAG TPA: prolyl oligopeptidase family serine peptidase [Vicinamibacterales bacterium]|nr:prolyl oligopeptidase family serine peptidase [Vicinamibacterales bacterium]
MTSLAPRHVALAVMLAATTWASPAAQIRRLQPEDYGRWEQLAAQRTPLSPDGRWLIYGITRGNFDSELRVQPAEGGAAVVTIPFGEVPVFSDDSRWLAALVGFSEADEARLRKEKKPLHKSLRLVELATGHVSTVEGIESFAFSAIGTHVAMRRYAPEPPGGSSSPSTGADERIRPGTTLVVRHLASGMDVTFGNVSEIAWQDSGARLAFVVTTEDGVGNAVQLYDGAAGTLRVLDSSPSAYSGLAWRKDAGSLAVLRSVTREGREGPTHVALVWSDVTTASPARTLDPTAAGALAEDLRVVRFRRPEWSDDGTRLYVGIAPWLPAAASAGTLSSSRRREATSTNPDELPDVVVWHPRDTTVMARQKIDARRDRERSMLATWWIDDARLVRIAQTIGQDARPIKRSTRAVVVDTDVYARDRSIGRVYSDVWTVDLQSGARTDVATRVLDRYLQSSPGGRYVLYLRDDHYWTVDLATGQQSNITANIATSFIDVESDATVAQKAPFGVAGWSRDDRSVLLYDQHDIWEVTLDRGTAVRLTDGRAAGVRYRYVRLDPEEEWIDRSAPLMVSQFGLRSKQSGFARVTTTARGTALTPLVWLDKRVDRLVKARRAERYAYIAQAFDDSPDYFVGDAALDEARQVTATNPFMNEFAWGRAELVEYRNARGLPLQGALFYPAGYEPGRRYPMVVYMYEKLSDGLHTFSLPSERSVYNAAAFTTRGYFYFQPDIVFRPREPGVSVVESVVPAVQRVLDMGLVDAARVGIVGHSWGGFDSSYLATHTTTFAAAVAGAPITNLVSNYGNHHWSSGIAETDHIETGQQRMEVPLYEDLDAYVRNSAVFRAHTMTTPLLVMFGENDGTVHWHQGVELYNIARRAGRHVVMLAYAGEDHGLRKRANQIDYHHRIFEWFDHYLKGAPAEPWITHGERFLDRERDLQQRKKPAPKTTETP